MERKTGFRYPCLVDVRKNCPETCRLYQKSVRNTLRSANEIGKTPEEYVAALRSGTPEMVEALNRMTARVLRDALLLEECQNIIDGKIDYLEILRKT
ncbi:MAG: hypothetical protein ACOYT7_01735 [Patescibacteria group bacterium]